MLGVPPELWGLAALAQGKQGLRLAQHAGPFWQPRAHSQVRLAHLPHAGPVNAPPPPVIAGVLPQRGAAILAHTLAQAPPAGSADWRYTRHRTA